LALSYFNNLLSNPVAFNYFILKEVLTGVFGGDAKIEVTIDGNKKIKGGKGVSKNTSILNCQMAMHLI